MIEVRHAHEHGRAHACEQQAAPPIQAYCDLLEVRWLLSEQAGHDVGTNERSPRWPARRIPTDSAAKMAIAEVPTATFGRIRLDED